MTDTSLPNKKEYDSADELLRSYGIYLTHLIRQYRESDTYCRLNHAVSADLESSIGGVSAFQSDVGADKELCEFYEHLSLHTTKLCNFTGVAVEYIQRTTGVILEADEATARIMELAGRTEE